MTTTSHNYRADIDQYYNNKELKSLRQVYLKNNLTTIRINVAITTYIRKIDPVIYPPNLPTSMPWWFLMCDWVQITNQLRDEYVTLCKVIKISKNFSFVYIKGVPIGERSNEPLLIFNWCRWTILQNTITTVSLK